MTASVADVAPRETGAWRRHLITLGIVAVVMGAIFARDFKDMLVIWWTSSTYGHCLFIPFLIGWMVSVRRDVLVRITPRVWGWGLGWLAGGSLFWLLGDAAGVGMVRHVALVIMMQGLVAALLGAQVVRALLFPLFFAFFMVPFGAEIVPPLQLVTARMAVGMLDLAGIPAHLDGIFITTSGGYFEVAEACSGAKFVIAMTAYGALVCHVCFRSWLRRVLFLAGALLLSILANGVRAFATIAVAQATSVDAAVGFDHVVYGWLFFALVMTVVMAGAWPFFDRSPADPFLDPADFVPVAGDMGRDVRGYAALAFACLLIGPGWSMAGAAGNAARLPAPAVPVVAGWTRTLAPMAHPWEPRFAGASHKIQARYRNARGQVVDLVIATFAAQSEGAELIGFGQGAVDNAHEWVWSAPALDLRGGQGARITAPGPVVRDVVSHYRVGKLLSGRAGEVKLATMTARLMMRDQRAAAVLISAEDRPGQPAADAIAAFASSAGSVELLADAALGRR